MRKWMPTMLTVTEVAAVLRVHPQTVRKLVRDGSIAAHKMPTRGAAEWRIPLEGMERFLERTATGRRVMRQRDSRAAERG